MFEDETNLNIYNYFNYNFFKNVNNGDEKMKDYKFTKKLFLSFNKLNVLVGQTISVAEDMSYFTFSGKKFEDMRDIEICINNNFLVPSTSTGGAKRGRKPGVKNSEKKIESNDTTASDIKIEDDKNTDVTRVGNFKIVKSNIDANPEKQVSLADFKAKTDVSEPNKNTDKKDVSELKVTKGEVVGEKFGLKVIKSDESGEDNVVVKKIDNPIKKNNNKSTK